MQMQDKIVINDYIENDPLSDENLDGVLDLVTEINKRYNIPQDIVRNNNSNHNILSRNTDEIRLSLPNKSIWIYSGYTWENIMTIINMPFSKDEKLNTYIENDKKRKVIVGMCDVFIDGRYIDSQRDTTLKWRGSKNQRVIDVQNSLNNNKITLYCN